MNKKLLLTLLPLTFLIAACGGGSQPTPSSSSQPTPSSSANSSADPASSVVDPVESSSVGEPEESSSVVDPVTPDLSAHYVTLGEAEPVYLYQDETYDPLTDIWAGASAKFTTGFIDVTAGESILVTAVNDDETTTSVYANGFNANNNVEGTGPDGYTVKTTAEDAVLDLYQYADGGWAFNLSGAGEGGEGEGGGEGGTVVENKYCIYSVTNGAAVADLVLNGQDPSGKDQAQALGVSLTQGDVIQLYDKENSAGWITTIEGWSFGGDSGTSTAWEAYLEAGTDSWTVLQDVTVDIYAKFQMNNDSIYFGISSAA